MRLVPEHESWEEMRMQKERSSRHYPQPGKKRLGNDRGKKKGDMKEGEMGG